MFDFFSILINRDNFGRHGNQEIVTFQNVLVLARNKIPFRYASYTHCLYSSVAVARLLRLNFIVFSDQERCPTLVILVAIEIHSACLHLLFHACYYKSVHDLIISKRFI